MAAGWPDTFRRVWGWLSTVAVDENPETIEVEFNVSRAASETFNITRAVSREFGVARTITLTAER